jgi:transcriptional regulator with XRE-family HTH domain
MFGAKLREYRGRNDMSLDGLSGIVNVSKTHLSRIENAEYMIPPGLPEKLDAAFGTEAIFTDLYSLAKKEIHPDKFRRRMNLEARATVIKEYSPQVVPGLLQVESYARAQFAMFDPRASAEVVDELVTGRITRQGMLLGDPRPDYAAILDEAVLRRAFGGPSVMREQLQRLLELTLTPSTFIQVLPFEHGGHALVGGSLSLWSLDDGTQVAYEEAISTGTVLEEISEVQARVRAYDLLSASALSPVKSADLIRSVVEAIPHEHHHP